MFSQLFKPQPAPPRFSVHEPGVMLDVAATLQPYLSEAKNADRDIVFVCIGTDRSTGDSLGPLTGTKLHAYRRLPNVFGTLDDPVHAGNLHEQLQRIESSFHHPYVIAIDACLGRLENVGCLTLGRGPVKPGAAVKKDLPPVGDIYITGVVNVSGFMEHLVLQSTRLNLVMKMADAIAKSIYFALHRR